MSAPRTNAAIAERMDEWREKKATQESFSANDIEFCREVSAALRKEPPALPAEVEALIAQGKRVCEARGHGGLWASEGNCIVCALATLLHRYAQAVALFEQRDSECNRVARESGVTETPEWAQGFDDGYVSGIQLNPVIEDVTAALKQAVAEKDAKLQAVEALCAEPLPGGNPAIVALARLKNIRKILREEH